MSYTLTDKQFSSIRHLSDAQRYDYFIRTVARWEQVWSLHSPDGWVELSVEDGQIALPVWPHPDFAQAWAVAEWSDCQPKAVALDMWLERWTPGLEQDDTVLVIFPVDEGEGVVETPSGMAEALLAELE